MRKSLIFVIAVVALSGCVQQTQKNETIKIGADFAMTGNAARYGEWASRGASIAAEETNSAGGVNGKNIEIVIEDNHGQAGDAVSAYNKLKSADNVKYVVSFISTIALAIAKEANSDKIIQMDISATTPLYSTPNDYTFRTGIVATHLAKESATILYAKFNVTSIGILYINNDFGSGMLSSFKKNYNGTIIMEESFNQDDTDFRTQLLKLKEANISTVLLVSHLKEGGIIVKQAKELDIHVKFFSDVYSVEGPDFIDISKDAADGIIYVAPKFDTKDPRSSSFANKYRQKFGEEPTVFSAQSYDGVIALSRAMNNCVYDDTECVRSGLMNLDFEGSSGHIKFDINGDVQKPVVLKTIVNGTFVRVD